MISALTITIADYTGPQGTLTVEWVGTDAGRQEYRYTVAEMDQAHMPGEILATGTDLRSGTGDDPDHVAMMAALCGFLSAAGDSFGYHLRDQSAGDDHGFPVRACEWAYANSDELSMAQMELALKED